jgi:hypothetical protein
MTLLGLPSDLWTLVLPHLQVPDLLSLRASCKTLKEIVETNTIEPIHTFTGGKADVAAQVFKMAKVCAIEIEHQTDKSSAEICVTSTHVIRETGEILEHPKLPSIVQRHYRLNADGQRVRTMTFKSFLRQKKTFFTKTTYYPQKAVSYNIVPFKMGIYLTDPKTSDRCGLAYSVY